MADRCIICGRPIEKEEEANKGNWWEEDDFIPKPKKKPSSFCQLCEAKIKKESDEAHKGPKKQM